MKEDSEFEPAYFCDNCGVKIAKRKMIKSVNNHRVPQTLRFCCKNCRSEFFRRIKRLEEKGKIEIKNNDLQEALLEKL